MQYVSLAYKPKYRRHHKKSKRAAFNLVAGFMVFTIVLSIWMTFNTFANSSYHSRPELVYEPVVVHAGDSLWKLAQTSELEQDPRAIIVMIKNYNALPNGVIYPGQVIYIPQPTTLLAYKAYK